MQDAEAQLASLQVVAPLSGTVVRLNVKPGEAVDVNTVVAEVMDLNRLAVSDRHSAAQAGELKTGEEVQVLTEPPVTAALSFVSPAVDTNSGTVRVWAALPADSGLRPGQFVPLRIVTAVHTNCLAAPEESVVTDENGNSVIALVNGDEAMQTPVQTGFRENGWVEIEGNGLKAGDTVVTVGAYGLPEKTQIQVVNPSAGRNVGNQLVLGSSAMTSTTSSRLGRFATRHAISITFIAVVLCLAGIFCARNTPSSVFPKTDFPRVVVMVNNGIMPANEMMATITRPIEEAMKSIPGVVSVRSSTTRGSAIINVIFNWGTDMQRAELYVLGQLSEIRSDLPATASTDVSRVAFSLSYPIIGISLTSSTRNQMDLWDTATYTIKPLFLQIPGVAKVEILGGHVPEYHVVVDPLKLQAAHLGLQDVSDALTKNNLVAAAGMIVENYHLYLTTVDGRVHSPADIGNVVIAVHGGHPIRIQDVAKVERGPAPAYTVITAQGRQAVLFNIESQPDASMLEIAADVEKRPGATAPGTAAGHAPGVFLRPIPVRAATRWAASGTPSSSASSCRCSSFISS